MSPELIKSWRLSSYYTPAKGVFETLSYSGRGNRGWPLGNIQLELDLGYLGLVFRELIDIFLAGLFTGDLRMASWTVPRRR